MNNEFVPNGWASVHLGDVIDRFESGRNLQAHGRPAIGDEFGVLKISAVTWGTFQPKENKALLPGDAPKPHELIRAGDVLISRANTTELVGAPVYVQHDYPTLMLPDKVLRIVFVPALINGDFLTLALKTPVARDHFEREATGTSDSMRNLSQPKLAETPIALPPLPEQRRIVSKIESLTARSRRAKEALDAIPKLLEQFRQSVLASAFRGDLTAAWRAKNPDVEPAEVLLKRIRIERRKRWEEAELAKMRAKGKTPADDKWKAKYEEPAPVDTSDLPELPEGWAWARAEEVCEFITKGTTPSADKLFSNNGDVPYIKVYNLTHRGILDFSIDPTFISTETHRLELTRSKVIPGDILMNIVGPPLGKVSVVPSTFPEWNINQAIAVFRPIRGLNVDLFCAYLLWQVTIERLSRQAKATAGQFNLTLEICRNMPVPLPPLAEQNELTLLMSNALKRIANAAAIADTFGSEIMQLNRSILSKAFRGELVPQDPADEPASVLLARIRGEAAKPGAVKPKRGRSAKTTQTNLKMDDE